MAPLATIPVHRGCDRWRCGETVALAIVDPADHLLLSSFHWTLCDGYARRSPAGRRAHVLMHRQVLGLAQGDLRQGDHINGDRLDNRRSNLRIVTAVENSHNRRPRRDASSGYRGVVRDKKRWRAYCSVAGRRRYFGSYSTPEEAALVAQAARLHHLAGAVD